MTDNTFDTFVCKKNNDLEHLSDYDLVELSQKDIENFRREWCVWKCSSCGNEFTNLDYLLMNRETYIHEVRCMSVTHFSKKNQQNKRCNGKMILINKYDKKLDSIYFNELFARYQKKLIQESMGCDTIDHPDEVYSILVSAFLKIVAQFNRVGNLSKKSEKWFSSFLWQSIQNKIADIKKTNNYAKRSPLIKCECCGENVGQITQQHLKKEGHEEIINAIYFQYGKNYMKSNEIDIEEYNKEDIIDIGEEYLNTFSDSKRRKMIDDNLIQTYAALYPYAIIKNKVMSINEKVSGEEDSVEIVDMLSEPSYNMSMIEDIDIEDKINQMADIIITKYSTIINEYFLNDFDNAKKKTLIIESLKRKVDCYVDDCNIDSEIDMYVCGVKDGFTKMVTECLRNSTDCLQMLGKNEKSYHKI